MLESAAFMVAIRLYFHNAQVVKLVTTADLKSAADRRTSSSLVPGTKYNLLRSDLAEVEDATPLRSVRM